MANFPTSLDTFTNPAGTTPLAGAGQLLHSLEHATANDILLALETKLGIGAGAPPASAAVLRRSGTGASSWGQIAAGDYGAGSIVNADIAAAAAIQASKLNAAGVANRVIATADGINVAHQQVATAMLGTGSAAGFKSVQNNTTQSVASTTYVSMTGSGLSVTSTGGLILFGVTLMDLGSSAAASFGVQIWESPTTVIVGVSNEVVPAGVYKTTTTLVTQTGISAGTHSYFLAWKATAGTMTCNAICFWALEIKTPIQGP